MELEAKELGAINLLQSTIHLMQDDDRMAEFLARGLAGLPGVGAVALLIRSTFCTDTPGHLPGEERCREFFRQFADAVALNRSGFDLLSEFKADYGVECLFIQTISRLYGMVVVDRSCSRTFDLYRPYLENLAGIVALVIENNTRKAQLTASQKDLEQAVADRTRELAESRERFDLALDAVRDAVWDWQVDTGKVFFTPRWYTMLGYEAYELPQAFETWQELIHPDDRDHAEQTVNGHLETGIPFEMEFRMKTKLGSWKWILGRGQTVKRDKQGNPARMVGTHMDITERKQMEAHLQQAQKMEAIGTLAGGIAHDFNNILFPLLGFSELLRDDLPKDSPLLSYVREIRKAGMRAKELVHQILTFSRQSKQDMELMSAQPIIKEALKLLKSSIPATIGLTWHINHKCGPLLANPTQVHQIVMNLVTNAFHATEKNQGSIRVTYESCRVVRSQFPELSPGEYARLSVRDTGKGIPAHVLPRVFDPYFTTKAQNRGTGLGLSVVQGIVKRAKGRIDIQSRAGDGTTVTVLLPVTDRTSEIRPAGAPPEIPRGSEHILLVDDEPSIVDLVAQMLKRLGYRVTACTESKKALETFKAFPDDFSLVFTDMTMPGMTGLSLVREIRDVAPDIPVIICTGFSNHLTEEKIKNFNIQGYLKKPVIKKEMALTLRKVLDGTRSQDTSRGDSL